MEKNFSETLTKAKTYFINMLKEREKYMQEITVDLPKRIEIQTLPLSTPKNNAKTYEAVDKSPNLEININVEQEKITGSKSKLNKKIAGVNKKDSQIKIDNYNLIKINQNMEQESCKNKSSSSTTDSSSTSEITESPVSTIKISTSSSTLRIQEKCLADIEKAKNYIKNKELKEKSRMKKPIQNNKMTMEVNEVTYTKIENIHENIVSNIVNTNSMKPIEQHSTRKRKSHIPQKKITCFEALTPAKKYLRSKMGIDQKSINVKKDNKDNFLHSKIHENRMPTTKIKTYTGTATKDGKKNVLQKDNSQSDYAQTNEQSPVQLTPAKKYLRSKLGIDEKTTNTKRGNTKFISTNLLAQDVAVNVELKPHSQLHSQPYSQPQSQPQSKTQPKTQPQSQPQPKTQPQSQTQSQSHSQPQSLPQLQSQPQPSISTKSPVKIDQSIIRNKENNLKKISTANETHKIEKHSAKQFRDNSSLSAKTVIIANIQPYLQETNKLSIELKRPVILTSSMEKVIAKALKIGLKKINRTDLQNLQLKIKGSVQSRNNITSLEPTVASEQSNLVSMQSLLETKISNFQTEMERRQKHTFDKIQELENTIQFRKQQLMEINKNKKTLRNYDRNVK